MVSGADGRRAHALPAAVRAGDGHGAAARAAAPRRRAGRARRHGAHHAAAQPGDPTLTYI